MTARRSEVPSPDAPEPRGGMTGTSMGAYGLRLTGLDVDAGWLTTVSPGAAELRVRRVVGELQDGDRSTLDERAADLRLRPEGRLRMRRGVGTACFSFTRACPALDLLHPFLAPAAALAQLWAGREAIHAGAFVGAGGAVALLAGKGGGKSTTLARLALHEGVTVLADDLVVLDTSAVYPGPRCIDLRVQPNSREPVDGLAVRDNSHRRVRLGPVNGSPVPLVGVVILDWGPQAQLRELPLRGRLPALASQRMFARQLPIDQRAALDLIVLPWARLTRPRGERGLRAATRLLVGYP